MKILIDFDSTCVIENTPNHGPDIPSAVSVLRELVGCGHELILFTARNPEDGSLVEAVNWFRQRKIPLQVIQQESSKPTVDLIIDDKCLGIPLISNFLISEHPFVDWASVRELLITRKIIEEKFE